MSGARSVKFFFYLAILLFVSSCQKDEEMEEMEQMEVMEEVAEVHPALKPYFDKFVHEGSLRGWTIDIDAGPIHGLLEILDEELNGECNVPINGRSVRWVVVNQLYWNTWDDLRKEYIVFHELGHCALDRDHQNDVYPDGTCVTMMADGDAECMINYTLETRSVYLDELFKN